MIVIETAGLTPEVMAAMPAEHQYWSYNGLDTCITHEVRQVLEEQLPPEAQAVYQFCLGSQAPALEMMLRGIRIDQTYRQAELLRNLNEIEQLQSNLDAFAEAVWERGLNPRSPTQLQKFFYGTLKLPPQWKNDKGNRKISTDREALEGLRAYLLAQPFVSHILAIRDRTKTAGVLSTGIDADGRIRCSYNIGGTETGRWSSSANAFGTGTNLQNITPRLRRMFIADPGFMFCNVDLEQAESRVVGLLAWLLTGQSSYLDACESGDLHTTVCKMIWPGLAWPGDPKGDKELAEEPNFLRHFSRRDIAKRVGHGTNYYGQPHSIAKIVGIPREFVEQFQTAYFRAFPEIRDWHRDTARTLQTTGKLTTPLGRTRHFFGRLRDDATLREAIAYVPQSTIGDLMNIAVNRLWRWGKVQLLAQVHDSELFQFPEGDHLTLVSEALSVMRVPLSFPGRLFEIPLEAKVGWNWGYYNDDPKRGPINVDGLKGLPNKRKRAYPAA